MINVKGKWMTHIGLKGNRKFNVSMKLLQSLEYSILKPIYSKLNESLSFLNESLKGQLGLILEDKLPEVHLNPILEDKLPELNTGEDTMADVVDAEVRQKITELKQDSKLEEDEREEEFLSAEELEEKRIEKEMAERRNATLITDDQKHVRYINEQIGKEEYLDMENLTQYSVITLESLVKQLSKVSRNLEK